MSTLTNGQEDDDPVISSATTRGVLVILPTLNERENIGPILDGIHSALDGMPHTVCIIDDGSTDGTLEKIQSARARHDRRLLHLIERTKRGRGSQRGGALRAGLEWGLSATDHTVFVEMDGDLSHRPEELRTGIQLIERGDANVAIASKYVGGSQVVNRPLRRRLVSRVSSIAVGLVISGRIRDYSNGYRFYDRAAAELIRSHRTRYGSPIYLTEVLALWLRSGLKIIEFPSIYVGRNEGLSKLRLIDLLKAGLAVFEIGVRFHLTGFGASQAVSPAASLTVPTIPGEELSTSA